MQQSDWTALLWTLLLAGSAAVYLLRQFLRSDYSWWETILYAPTYLMGRLVWRVHFLNDAPAELATGGILVANHRSSVDPFFVQLAARRRVHWMVASEYCRHPAFGPLLRLFEVIPTNRSGVDTASTKQAIRLARATRLVGMFPEGQLNHTQLPLLPVRSGAAMVADRASKPIIPLHIHGSPFHKTVWSPLFMRGNVGITWGQPIFPVAEESQPEEIAATAGSSQAETAQHVAPAHPAAGKALADDSQLASTDQMILKWARQVVRLAGHEDFPVSLARRRQRRKRR